MGPDAMILVFWMLSFKPTFSLAFFTFKLVTTFQVRYADGLAASGFHYFVWFVWQTESEFSPTSVPSILKAGLFLILLITW